MTRLTDFRLAGFLVARGHKVQHAEMNGRGDVEFVFDAAAVETLNEYPGSPEQRYDASCKAMHNMVRATLGRHSRR